MTNFEELFNIRLFSPYLFLFREKGRPLASLRCAAYAITANPINTVCLIKHFSIKTHFPYLVLSISLLQIIRSNKFSRN